MIDKLPLVFEWGLKATPLLLLAWLATAALRRGSAAQRHFIWTLAVGGALLMPVLSIVAPPLGVAVIPVPEPVVGPPVAGEPAPVSALPAWSEAPRSAGLSGAAIPAGEGPDAPLLTPGLLIWAGGALLIGLLVASSLVGTALLGRRGVTVASGPLAEELDMVRGTLGIRRPVRLLLRAGTMPMTWGLWRPSVLLPSSVSRWPAARRRAVLFHELAHVRRGDWLSQLAARCACALYWWHPLVWLAAWRLRCERELASDDLVLAHGTVAADYAFDLLEIARGFRIAALSGLAGVAMARPSQLAGRLLAVLDAARTRRPLSPVPAVVALLLALGVSIPAAGLRAVPLAASPVPALDAAAPSLPELDFTRVSTAGAPGRGSSRLGAAEVQGTATLCDWQRRGESQSSSTNLNEDRATIRIELDGCELHVRSAGRVGFTADEREISSLERDGYFEIEERQGRERRRVEVTSRPGGVERRWYVNGSQTAWDASAAGWFRGALLATFRRTSFQARERAQRILAARGPQGLRDEIPHLFSSSALTRYYIVLIGAERLTAAEASRMAEDAGARISSSSGLADVLDALLQSAGGDDGVRIAAVRAAGQISSSSARARVLVAAVGSGSLGSGLADAVLQETAEISSSSEKGRVLRAVAGRLSSDQALPASYVVAAQSISSSSELSSVLVDLIARDRLSPQAMVSVLQAAKSISSSSALGEVLRAAATRQPIGERTRGPFFDAAGQIGSSSERAAVLHAVVAQGPDAGTVAAILGSAEGIGSNSAKAEVLVAVARSGLLSTEGLRGSYRRVAGTIGSRSERERVLEAAGMN